jgi:hypothetical protein
MGSLRDNNIGGRWHVSFARFAMINTNVIDTSDGQNIGPTQQVTMPLMLASHVRSDFGTDQWMVSVVESWTSPHTVLPSAHGDLRRTGAVVSHGLQPLQT